LRDIVYVNGRYLPREQAVVNVEDRGYQFADGVYDVVRFHGRRDLRARAHLERLQQSCEALRIFGTPDMEKWLAIIEQLLDECEITEDDENVRILYQQISRGVCPRSHTFPKTPCEPSVVAYFRAAPVYSPELRKTGVGLSTQPDERWNRCNIKAICLLPVILAKQAAVEAGALDALLVRGGVVTEGGSTNAYCVRDGTVWTHPEGPHILPGITRTLVFEAAHRAGVPIHENAVTLEEFRAADEAFISSTTMDIMPATRLDGKPIGKGSVGPVTSRLMEQMGELIAQEIRGPAAVTK
jgi:D-alanine transaminase